MRHPLRSSIFIGALLLAGLTSAASAQTDAPILAQRQMAATANPIASRAALTILREGGTALDAAIAAQMVLAVVEPQASGLGGGGLLLVWDPKTRALTHFEGLASAPAALPLDYAHDEAGKRIELKKLERSGRVVAVPGAIRLLAMAHADHGRLPWARLFAEAIDLAENGFPMQPYLRRVLVQRAELASKPGFGLYFDAGGAPHPVGTALRNPDLAATLRRVATEGADALYRGPLADALAQTVSGGDLPGSLVAEDLAQYRAVKRDPVCLTAFARRICSAAPPSSGGIALLQQLAILDRLGVATLKPGAPEAIHLFLEASRLTMADRRSHLGDPDQIRVPIAGLLDPAYLDARARELSPERALSNPRPGTPPSVRTALPESDPVALPATTHISIIDAEGGVAAFTTTNNLNFGADIVAAGVVLNDAITNFATFPVVGDKRVANAGAPGKRPIATMAPTIVFGADDKPLMIVGAGGGARIIDSVAETILGVLAWGLDVRQAIEQPRYGAQTGNVELERGTRSADAADALRALGHEPRIQPMDAGVQAIVVSPRGLEGWADPRRDGAAAGD